MTETTVNVRLIGFPPHPPIRQIHAMSLSGPPSHRDDRVGRRARRAPMRSATAYWYRVDSFPPLRNSVRQPEGQLVRRPRREENSDLFGSDPLANNTVDFSRTSRLEAGSGE